MDHDIDRLRVHLRLIDQDVAPVVERYASQIQCKPGCSQCCTQTFLISDLEGEYLRQGLKRLDRSRRSSILERARGYQPHSKQPCPVLDDEGRCQLYEHRPRICRKYGILLWHPDRPNEVTTCELNFRQMDDVDPELILEPQAQWARDWLTLQAHVKQTPPRTIAEQLLADQNPGTQGVDPAD